MDAGSSDMIAPGPLLSILWLLWLVSWAAAAQWSARTVARQSGLARLGHGVFWWAGATLLFVRPERLGGLIRPLFPGSAVTEWAGVVLCGAGLAFTWWARISLGRFWSAAVTLKAEHALVKDGPYGWTRHPIYTGLLLALIGTALSRDTIAGLLGLGFLLAGIIVKIRQEERLLLDHFGPDYETYRHEVPALIPRLG
jgi:protein-S-isoprenylcysteine O-methyltransferase Ste14